MLKLKVCKFLQTDSQIKGQEFQRLRDAYKNERQKFEDWEFPPGEDSLGEIDYLSVHPHAKIVWKRPHELVREWNKDPKAKPLFFGSKGVCRFDIAQGGLGDCWYLSSLAQLACEKNLLRVVVPDDNKNGFDDGEYSGAFHFRYWRAGTWTEVVIDDRLPCVKDKTGVHRLICTLANHNEFWTVLAEKAFAKLYGSYQLIEGGLQSEALEDFSGGISILNAWEENDIEELLAEYKDTLRRAHKRKSFIGVSSKSAGEDDDSSKCVDGHKEKQSDEGIAADHAYSVTGIKEVKDKRGNEHFILRLRNPWGCSEWNGKWSDSDDASWATVPKDLRSRGTTDAPILGGGCDDGEFWISLEDVIKRFDQMSICYWSPLAFEGRLGDIDHVSWDVKMLRGSWNNAENLTPWTNNAHLLKFASVTVKLTRATPGSDPLLEDSDSSECTMVVAIMYELFNKSGPDELLPSIGFRIFQVPDNHGNKPYGIQFFKTAKEITEGEFRSNSLRELNEFFKLEEGTYCIVPIVDIESPQEGNEVVSLPYLLRIFSERKITVKN